MNEVLHFYYDKIQSSPALTDLNLNKGKYILVSAHREENINSSENFKKFISIINYLADEYNLPVIVSTHPRTLKMINTNGVQLAAGIQLLKPFSFSDYVHLQVNALITLSDSGTISEESSILNFPALNIREAHERPEAMEEASVMMVGMNKERILQAMQVLKEQKRDKERTLRQVGDYSMPNVSDKIVRIILSYTDYIKRVIWSENN
jgi:UDP-N-acetylglucosamine 2-epimerase (non-hydrolysing)